jgi:hypothetical protein
LVFRVVAQVFLDEGANRNHVQLILARILQRSVSQLRAQAMMFKRRWNRCVRQKKAMILERVFQNG